jgi:GTPase
MVLHHQTTMSVGYEAFVHCGVVRQAVRLVQVVKKRAPSPAAVPTREVDAAAAAGDSQSGKSRAARTARASVPALSTTTTPVLRTGDRAVVRFRFCCYAEYLEPGAVFLFREGFAKGLGKVKRPYAD